MKISFSTEVKAALLITITLGLFIWGFNLLKGTRLFVHEYNYFALYDRVEGLVASNPVLVNGYHVGQVSRVQFHPVDQRKILVYLTLHEEVRIPKNSIAKIYSSDLLGSKAIEIMMSDDTAAIHPGDTILGETEMTLQEKVDNQVAPLKKKAENLILSIDSVISVVQAVLNTGARENLSKSFESIKRAIEKLESTSLKLDALMDEERSRLHNIFSNIESITSNVKDHNKEISSAITNISQISDTLARSNLGSTLDKTEKALSGFSLLLEKVNRGEGTLGNLLHNDSLYGNLNEATENMNKLVKDLEENPGRYVHFSVFGRKDKKK
ncbi:MAG: MCE family protein [Bacteroidetes bacterium]|nr:MCE family protein [Bacteroidota bacterium]